MTVAPSNKLRLDFRLVLHQCIVGVGEELSTVVAGVVARLDPEMVTAVQALQRPTRVMVRT